MIAILLIHKPATFLALMSRTALKWIPAFAGMTFFVPVLVPKKVMHYELPDMPLFIKGNSIQTGNYPE
jgi:hypothetical protein